MKELTFVNVLSSFNRTAKDYKQFINNNSNDGPFWHQLITNAINNNSKDEIFACLRVTNVIDKDLYYIVQFTINEYDKNYKLTPKSKSFWLNKEQV